MSLLLWVISQSLLCMTCRPCRTLTCCGWDQLLHNEGWWIRAMLSTWLA